MTKRLPGRLNVFQVTMLEWREQHPYTAVHALRVPKAPDLGVLAAAIDAERSQLGLGLLTLDRRRHRYAWHEPVSATPIAWLAADGATVAAGERDAIAADRAAVPAGAGDAITSDAGDGIGINARTDRARVRLAQEIEHQMNTPFAGSGTLDPFRFFAIPAEDCGFVGVAYDHFIAGGDSIVRLMNRIADRLAGAPQPDRPIDRYPSTRWPLVLRHPLRVARAMARMPSMASSCRRTMRPSYHDITDGHNGFALHRVDTPGLDALQRCARRWGVTFNDLLLAALLLARDPATRARHGAARRRELAAASIMNLRDVHGDTGRDVFGQSLGSFRVSHAVPPGITLEALARDIHRDTARVKHEHLYLAGLIAMRADRVIGRFQTARQRMSVYAKGYPVNAATSTLNVDSLWRDGTSSVPEYLRGVPTGPLAPMVLAATTAAGQVCAGISYRTTAFSRADVDAMWKDVADRIRSLP